MNQHNYLVFKKKYLLLFLILFLYACNSRTDRNISLQSNIKDKSTTLKKKVSVDTLEQKYLYRIFVESIKYNNTKKENIIGLKDGKEIKLKTLLRGKQKLVIEYSPLSCGLCVDSLFTYVSKSKLNKDLIVITGSKNINLVKVELNKYNVNGAILMTDITEETLKQTNTEPKIYLLETNMTIHHYITIDKLMVKYLKSYIKLMEEKL